MEKGQQVDRVTIDQISLSYYVGQSARRVSVIIPVYNVERYLKECLESVLAQTYQNIEVILVNDGSTDSSKSIAEEYTQNDSWHLISQENRGLSEARHTGLLHSSGDYILFLDSDDVLAPEAIRLGLYQLVKHDVDIAVFSYREFVSHDDLVDIYKDTRPENDVRILKEADPLRFHLTPQPRPFPLLSMIACGKIYKRHLLDDIDWNLINFKVNEDEAFICYPYSKASNGLVAIDKQLYCYRKNPDSITRSHYQNIYHGQCLTRLEFLKLLWKVQGKILGNAHKDLTLNYFVSNTVYAYTRDLLGTDDNASEVDDRDIKQLSDNIGSCANQYLEFSTSMTDPFVRAFVEAYAAKGFTGFMQHLLDHQRMISQHEIATRDAQISQLESKIAGMVSSRSWKITAPLRKAKSLMRRDLQ